MKTILTTLLILIYLNVNSQETKISAMVGYEFDNGLSFVGSIDAVNAVMCGLMIKL